MKVAVLYICTGKYNQFFKGFFESSEKHFLKGIATVEYFVFTDDMSLINHPHVHLFKRECQGFPLDSLFRFDMFLSIEDQLKSFDYCFFFNANMEIVSPIGEEFLPAKEGLMAVTHPGFYNRPCWMFPYERSKKSTAYVVPHEKSYTYYMGSLNGGRTVDFLKMAHSCSENTHKDYDKGIIAYFHDESHLNKYMRDHSCLALSPAYAYPENFNMPFEPRIVLRDKEKIDSYFKKNKKDGTFLRRAQKMLNYLYRGAWWYI